MADQYLKIMDNAIKYHQSRGHILIVQVLKGVLKRMTKLSTKEKT